MEKAGASKDDVDWWFIIYFVTVRVALLAVTCWARRLQADHGKLLSLAVSTKVPSEGNDNTAAELLNEFGRGELRGVLRKKGELVSGIKADIIGRLCNRRRVAVVDDRTARLLAALREQTGRELPLAAVLDRGAATAWIQEAIRD